MSEEWYYQIMGEVVGPISIEELEEKAKSGAIPLDTLVRQGNGEWQPANSIDGLLQSAEPVQSPTGKWYFRTMGEVIGPMSMDQLAEEAIAGAIQPDTNVRQGNGDWQTADSIDGLFESPKPTDEPRTTTHQRQKPASYKQPRTRHWGVSFRFWLIHAILFAQTICALALASPSALSIVLVGSVLAFAVFGWIGNASLYVIALRTAVFCTLLFGAPALATLLFDPSVSLRYHPAVGIGVAVVVGGPVFISVISALIAKAVMRNRAPVYLALHRSFHISSLILASMVSCAALLWAIAVQYDLIGREEPFVGVGLFMTVAVIAVCLTVMVHRELESRRVRISNN